jgi:hypothetical protein
MADVAEAGLVAKMESLLRQPVYFREILAAARNQPYRAILRAWSDVRTRHALARDELGRYWLEKK